MRDLVGKASAAHHLSQAEINACCSARPARAHRGPAQGRRSLRVRPRQRGGSSPRRARRAVRGGSRRHRRRRLRGRRRHPLDPPRARDRRALPDRPLPGRHGARSDWQSLADPDTTLVVYMGLANLAEISARLIVAGCRPTTPAAAIASGTTAEQRVCSANLCELPERVRADGARGPVLFVIGRVVEAMAWLDAGRTVRPPRTSASGAAMAEAGRALAAMSIAAPDEQAMPGGAVAGTAGGADPSPAPGLRLVPRHDAEGRPRPTAPARRSRRQGRRGADRHDPARRPGHADAALGVRDQREPRRAGWSGSSRRVADERNASARVPDPAGAGVPRPPAADGMLRGTGDLGIVVERAAGSRAGRSRPPAAPASARVEGLGDLSHASAVFGRDGRFAFVFGRDGGLTKVDLLAGSDRAAHRPGRQRDRRRHLAGRPAGRGLQLRARRGARCSMPRPWSRSPTSRRLWRRRQRAPRWSGLVDAPGNRLVFSLYDAGEIWVAD